MNKAITDGITFQPTPFSAGLGVWSSGDGTPGSDTYAQSGSGAFVSADADFAGCLEVLHSAAVTKLRYMVETPILPGCYLRITARVKAVAGALPTVRIAGWAGVAGGAPAAGLPGHAPEVALTGYGEVVELTAIVGTGPRMGVDLIWPTADYGHFGLDLTGATGGLVRIDDIEIEDVTSIFTRDLIAMVDVRDYGAVGDGVTDDADAFDAADAAAGGRLVVVPQGEFFLGRSVTMQSEMRFEGRIVQAQQHRFILQREYHFESYLDAFGEEELAFKKAYQALINFADHESLDLCGRRVTLSAPVDMQACDPDKTRFETRRVIRNGQFEPIDGAAWDPGVAMMTGSYDPGDPYTISGLAQAGSIETGALVTGNGVGREVYVTAVDAGAGRVTLSQPLYGAAASQSYTFTRFRYLLDFSGYEKFSQFVLADIEFQGAGIASGIMMAPAGFTFHIRDCFLNRPRDRGVTSPGAGCQGMMIDRCQFISDEQSVPAPQRVSIGFNANANDIKIRDNRCSRFRHFGVIAGTGNLISGNHWFHGDSEPDGVRLGGIVLTSLNPITLVTANYCDNSFIEWTNEHSQEPDWNAQFSFGGLTITGNVFLAIDVARWFSFLVVKPYGSGHYLNGLSVTGNVFRAISGTIDRVEAVDDSIAGLDMAQAQGVVFSGNTFHNIEEPCANPAYLVHDQNTAATTWTLDPGTALPFGGQVRGVDGATAEGALKSSSNATVHAVPYTEGGTSSGRLIWPQALKGRVRARLRMDAPAA